MCSFRSFRQCLSYSGWQHQWNFAVFAVLNWLFFSGYLSCRNENCNRLLSKRFGHFFRVYCGCFGTWYRCAPSFKRQYACSLLEYSTALHFAAFGHRRGATFPVCSRWPLSEKKQQYGSKSLFPTL